MDPHGRLRRLATILPLFVLLLAAGPHAVAAEAGTPGTVSFSISDEVSSEDEMYVREGIRFAQDYLAGEFGIVVEERTIVNARPTVAENSHVIGVNGGRWIGIYTGSEEWRTAPPFLRVHVVVHEFVHVQQRELLGDRVGQTPLWLEEGLADYFGYQALVDAGLVSATAVEDYVTSSLVYGNWLPELAALEAVDAYQAQPANVYSLAYLAAKELVEGAGPRAVVRYYKRVAKGADWQDAFAASFKREPGEFYAAFEATRRSLLAPAYPLAFEPVAPADLAADAAIASAPERIKRGNQLLIAAETVPAARCSLRVNSPAGKRILNQPSFADATGAVFWLWTVPPATARGTARAAVDCGTDTARLAFKVA
jgi:hypothetical protein